jgi:hypothetical protein
MKIKVDLPDVFGENDDEIQWLRQEILIPNDMVIMSSEIGDELGVIHSIEDLKINISSDDRKTS